ncbi:hypothetical protein COV24_03070 [candidate division WWE3 bacterium CG10_big_fil_rev_8_21_14_0_10_32_10]|uniref:Uncharacterized protein n=1 Tax=candidate division WWE3 bacterium CG10_big_fil_rev_8_21_14_0_10_32_10 TaxID=1975090 RepID=A0A2H0RA40_UNCKA|nr:MAG: hypothetical protein COV24_03070 [candidate division WWE3 bacterium CG10_big_fil_rev_8_21_14_0_10_32_10]
MNKNTKPILITIKNQEGYSLGTAKTVAELGEAIQKHQNEEINFWIGNKRLRNRETAKYLLWQQELGNL